MEFCERCGTQLGTAAVFCGGCGKPVGAAAAVPLAGPGGAFGAAGAPPPVVAVDDIAGVSETWQRRFAAIEKAGGEHVRWWRWPDAKKLNWRERQRIYSNFWAFMFGPLYYLYLGLWRKAITLMLVVTAVDVIIGMAADALDMPVDRSLWLVSALTFQLCANIDYYRKTVLNRREWW